VRAHKAARGCGLKLIIGAEFRLADRQQEGLRLLLLAQNRAGYGNLSPLITLARRRSRKGGYRLLRSDLETSGLLPGRSGAVPDCLALWVAAPGDSADDGRWLAQCFPARGWVAAWRHCSADDAQLLADLLALASASGLPAVAAGVKGGREPRKSGAAKKLGTKISGREPGPALQGCGLAAGNLLTNEPEKPRALHQAHEAA
jgi:error-prone DNA polymerase